MALPVQLNYYSNTDTSIENLQNTEDKNFKGKHLVSLTNYDTTGLPAIAIGSVVENNNSLLEFTTECAISGSPSDGTVYIYLVPSGDPALGTATVTPTFVNTAPTWSDSKQGWYGTVGSANYRYLEFKMKKASTAYSDKRRLDNDDIKLFFVSQNMVSGTTSLVRGTETTLIFETQICDPLLSYSNSTGIFTTPKTGYYEFNCNFYVTTTTSTAQLRSYNVELNLYKSTSIIHSINSGQFKPATTANMFRPIIVSDNVILSLTTGDTLYYTATWSCLDTNNANVSENGVIGVGAANPNLNIKYLGV